MDRRFPRPLLVAVFVAHLAFAAALAVLPVILFFSAETAGGRLFAGSALLLLLSFLAAWLLPSRKTRAAGVLAFGLCLAGSCGCLGGAYLIAPGGETGDGTFTQVRRGDVSFNPTSPASPVPEIDQLKLGTYLFQHLDPFIDRRQGARVRRLFLEVYREMRTDPAFVEAGSALGLCYEDLSMGTRRSLHFYQYVPRHLEKETYPVLVFLHGSFGNFKGYTWVLKALADAEGYAVIAPSYGCGNWGLDRWGSILSEVYEYCAGEEELDHETLVLAGLSNGGTGVTREIARHGGRYKGFAFISAVIEQAVLELPEFNRNAAARPFLIIHGEDDRRVPAGAVRASEGLLGHMGAAVTSRFYPGEDHFLFFSRRASVVEDLSEWLARIRLGAPAGE